MPIAASAANPAAALGSWLTLPPRTLPATLDDLALAGDGCECRRTEKRLPWLCCRLVSVLMTYPAVSGSSVLSRSLSTSYPPSRRSATAVSRFSDRQSSPAAAYICVVA